MSSGTLTAVTRADAPTHQPALMSSRRAEQPRDGHGGAARNTAFNALNAATLAGNAGATKREVRAARDSPAGSAFAAGWPGTLRK